MPFDPPRQVTDPRAMRALAHPVRLSLLEALTDGPLTATEAGERVGESPANASFHLRLLAKYGFVEEAEGGTGRRRPWKVKQLGLRFEDVHDDPEAQLASRELDRVFRDRYLARAEQGLTDRHALPPEWRAATGVSQFGFYLTPNELKTLSEDVRTLIMERFADRRSGTGEHPADAERVELQFLTYLAP
jgi:DNA-binding transcriptional ArsR family regulator